MTQNNNRKQIRTRVDLNTSSVMIYPNGILEKNETQMLMQTQLKLLYN